MKDMELVHAILDLLSASTYDELNKIKDNLEMTPTLEFVAKVKRDALLVKSERLSN